MTIQQEELQLQIDGFSFSDLFDPAKLCVLTETFYARVKQDNPGLYDRFIVYRDRKGDGFTDLEASTLLIEMAPYLSTFVARMFGVENEVKANKLVAERDQVIFNVKRDFFVRRATKKIQEPAARELNLTELSAQVQAMKAGFQGMPKNDDELEISAMVAEMMAHEKVIVGNTPATAIAYFSGLASRLVGQKTLAALLPADGNDATIKAFATAALGLFERWMVASYYQENPATKDWVLFRIPHKIDFFNLVEKETVAGPAPGMTVGPEKHYRHREGFDLTDPRYSEREAMSEVDYCVICHERGKDSCSKGFADAPGVYKKNPLGYELKGCPLDQKISESHVMKGKGDDIAALAIIAIDNPLCPGTGHRICNDCMKACIYQKQEPVNIPQAETRILTDVLALPWGFEIYSLLTRWNPLNVKSPQAQPFNGKKILVVGMGPAGYSLAHYFLNEGYGVVGIDGLKIEPLPEEWVGVNGKGFKPIKDIADVFSPLSKRVLLGFGGVSEYGITVRWDKNFLTVIYINLLRREQYRLYGGVRFGGTITVEDAWDLGFDHICIATGAGKPTIVPMKNNLIRGIRKASDFLMGLQLTGAGKTDSVANLQVQLPAVVIGGGLTAIDTATELMAYYPVQVTKVKERYEALCALNGKDATDAMFDKEDKAILAMFLAHAQEVADERARAHAHGQKPNFIPLIRKWGGVHLYYRKQMLDSPAYRLNHEEIIKAFEEGITFVENMSPVEAVPDEFGAIKEMIFQRMVKNEAGKWVASDELLHIPAKTVMVAAGTVPNIMYEKEYPNTFKLDKWNEFFQGYALRVNGTVDLVEPGDKEIGFFTSYSRDGKFISYYGDNHPVFEGNVVKAMASAKNGFKKVVELLSLNKEYDEMTAEERLTNWNDLTTALDSDCKPHVVRVTRLTPTIVEVVVHAPRAARKFLPGQFYRLQNYEVDSLYLDNTLLMMEGIALTGAWVDKEKGLLGMIALEMGSSSKMIRHLKPGQRVVVMGPTGTPTEIEKDETVILLGGGLGNAVLFSIAKAAKEKGGRVVYFAGYKKKEDFFKREEIEAGTDVVIYSVDSGDPIPAIRPQDKSFVGNIIQAMVAYSEGKLGPVDITLKDAHRIIAIGSDRMMAAVSAARHTTLKPYLNEMHVGIASINSMMQCMMKAICAQCVQRHIKPDGKEEFVFTCVNQDQHMDHVDFVNLNARLKANSVMEKLSNGWVNHLVHKHKLEGV